MITTELISEQAIHERITAMAGLIAPQLVTECAVEPIVVGLLKGSWLFCADMVRALSRVGVHPLLDFMMLSSYGNSTVSSGQIQVKLECSQELQGRTVLLLDDILDTGLTLAFAINYLQQKGAKEILTAVLLDKPERRQVAVQADFVGFTIANLFVVGYGIDYAERYRELPYIGFLTATE